MNTRFVRTIGAMALATAAFALVGCKSGIRVGGPSVEGTYQLVSRDLPDGTKVEPPTIAGMITFTDDQRQTIVYWDEGGKRITVCGVSEYELVDKRYWEQGVFYMINNEVDGSGLTYDLSRPGGSSAVVVGDNGVLSFDLPLYDEPSVIFTRNGFTATREGEFVDHWIRID